MHAVSFKTFFSAKFSKMSPKIDLSVCYNLGKSYSKYKSHASKFLLLDPNLAEGGSLWNNKKKDLILRPNDNAYQHSDAYRKAHTS